MENSIEKILSELVIKTAKHFNIDPQDALAAVTQSNLANELCHKGNVNNLTIEQLCEMLYKEIAMAV